MVDYKNRVLVKVCDPETGEVLEEKLLNDDYVVVCCGRRYLKSITTWGSTHQLNIAYDKGNRVAEPNSDVNSHD